MFILYQTIVLGHSFSSLRTAYKISEYVKDKAGEEISNKLGIDLDKTYRKQLDVRKLMVRMVADGLLSLDEYYDLFVSGTNGGSHHGHPWRLVKYYLLTDIDAGIPSSSTDNHPTANVGERRYKARLGSVGKAIRDSYIARRGKARFEREVLGGLAHGHLDGRWLWSQLQVLADEAQQQESQVSFDPHGAWRALGADTNIQELLYLLRLLWISSGGTRHEVLRN